MLFKRSKPDKSEARFPGRPGAADGHAAVFAIEAMASDVIVVQSTPDLAEITGPMRNLAPVADDGSQRTLATVHNADDAAGAAARITGASAAGLRAAAMVNRLGDIHASLGAAVGKRLTSVYHLTCRALPRHAGALQGSHDDYFAASDVGLFQFFARDVQEAADFTLIAHRVAERALTPGVVAQDYYRTSHSVQAVNLPEAELVDEYLGRVDDIIDCPTPSQRVLFGDTRRRVPCVVDPDHPAGTGGLQGAESYYKAMAAQRTYFAAHLNEIIAAELAQYAALTGRSYQEVSGYRVHDADVVVLAQGAVVDELEAVADFMRDHENMKVGVINLSVFRPFPGAALTRLLRGKSAVTVLERTDRPLSESLPLCAEVRAAVDKAVENGGSGEPLHRDHDIYRGGDHPRILTGVYGAGGELPTFGELVAMCRNMASQTPRPMVYLGLGEDTTIRRFPHLHSLQQSLNRDYPSRNDTVLAAADVAAPIPD